VGEVFATLLGERREEELLRTTLVEGEEPSPAQRRCLATFYLGARRLLRGDQVGGQTLLRECVATGVTDYPQIRSAEAMLGRSGR
jgi:hypothetical protein